MTQGSERRHLPVLLQQVCEYLDVSSDAPRKLLLDCTLGGAGHSEELMERNPQLFLFGIDRDREAVARAERRLSRFAHRMYLSVGNFADIGSHVAAMPPSLGSELTGTDFPRFDRILADLGLSSYQLDDPARGFSFAVDAPLDMRMDQSQKLSAASLINESDFAALCAVFERGGVGPASATLAREIIANRPFGSTRQLAEVCRSVLLAARRRIRKGRESKHHPATVPFQALRIAVNDELGSLRSLLGRAPDLLAPGGRLAMISFHSLEDELVTKSMRAWARPAAALRKLPGGDTAVLGKLLTRQAVVPDEHEIELNPRARSARLRVFERTAEQVQ